MDHKKPALGCFAEAVELIAALIGALGALLGALIGVMPSEWFTEKYNELFNDETVIVERYQNPLCGSTNDTVLSDCTSDGKYLYFAQRDGIYRSDMKHSEKSVTQLSVRASDYVSYYNDYIYFNDMLEDKLYRVSCTEDEPEPELLYSGPVRDMNYTGDWIVFRNDNDGSVYKMKPDGSELKRIIKRPVVYLYCDGEQMMFLNANDYTYYSTNMKGRKKEAICDIAVVTWPILVDDWIYFINFDDGYVYKMKKDGSSIKQLNDSPMRSLNYYEGRLYMTGTEGGIFSMNTDGSELKTYDEENIVSVGLGIVNGNMYYHIEGSGKLYQKPVK